MSIRSALYTRWGRAIVGIAVAALSLTGCYLPTRFADDIVITTSGDYALRYEGVLTSAGLAPGLMPDRPSQAQLEARVKNVTNDLVRDSGFRAVEYLGDGQFRVLYEREGNVFAQPGITFVRTDSRILSIAYVKTKNEITVLGASVPTAQRTWVAQAGLDMQGTRASLPTASSSTTTPRRPSLGRTAARCTSGRSRGWTRRRRGW